MSWVSVSDFKITITFGFAKKNWQMSSCSVNMYVRYAIIAVYVFGSLSMFDPDTEYQ